MSWDLYISDEWIGNYTHNTNQMIRAASVGPAELPEQPGVFAEVILHKPTMGTCWGDFEGRPAREAGLFARDIIAELKRDPERYEAMNPKNGWGSMESLVDFLREVAEKCESDPEGRFHASG